MQTNVQEGAIRILAGEDLTDKEGHLVVMTHDGGVPEVKLPTHVSDFALWVLDEEGEDADYVSILPLNPNRSIRVKLDSTCSPGDVLVNADPTAHAGMVRKLPTAAGTYRGIAIALESGVDGQEVLCRPASLGNITVST